MEKNIHKKSMHLHALTLKYTKLNSVNEFVGM